MNYILSFLAASLLVIGLAGNGFEMRKARLSTREEELGSKNMFLSKRNLKWFYSLESLLCSGLQAMPILDLYRSSLNISLTYHTLARVLGNAGLILDKRPKNKPTLTSYRYRLVEVN